MTDDPYAMYYVVRKDRPMTLGQAIAIAGAGAVRCVETYASSERWAAHFDAWRARPRKVALRADGDQFEEILGAFDSVAVDDTLLCLPPRRKSERGDLLAALAPFTDARRPREAPPRTRPALVYVVRRAVIKTMGKAMAQAGHAALLCQTELGGRHQAEFESWRERGMPGEVHCAEDEVLWARVKREVECVAVTDAGLTQVAPGTETMLAIPPSGALPALLAELERVP